MAPFVAADNNDAYVKHLTNMLMKEMEEVSKKSKTKNEKIADILTSENYVHVTKFMLTQHVRKLTMY